MFGWLKRFIPVSRRYMEWRMDELNGRIENSNADIQGILEELLAANRQLSEQNLRLESQIADLREKEDEHIKYLLGKLHDTKQELKNGHAYICDKMNEVVSLQKTAIHNEHEFVSKKYQETRNEALRIRGAVNEVVWAETFHDAIRDTTWLKNQAFVPGRWAAGYPFLYVLYRVLNEARPKSILELGLGQTTRMISQYAESDKNVEHFVTEHDESWIEFFGKSYDIPENSHILKQVLANEVYKQDDSVLVYENFASQIEDKSFDLICIDAPFGGQAQVYSRIDVLRCLPKCIKERFIIIMDDYNRPGEQNTVKEILAVLDDNGIPYMTKVYQGEKHTCIITSEDLAFLCSL